MSAEEDLHRLVAKRMTDLEAALQPFTMHSSSEEFTDLHVRTEHIRRARALLAPKSLHEEMPPWMTGMAHNIAVEYVASGFKRDALERDITNAMREAAREVALYFAANPKAPHA